jgi:hypothetical protein
VIPNGRLAFANARVRALKSQLSGADLVARLGVLRRLQSPARVSGDPRPIDDVASLPARGFHQLVAWYGVVLHSYPAGQPLVLALLRLHEIENLKLAWRAAAGSHAFDRWKALWQPLGALESLRIEDCRDVTSLQNLAELLQVTPYRDVAEAMLRTHARDLLAAELGFDRWASQSIVHAAVALDRSEVAARALALAVVRERDLNLLSRGPREFGLSPDAVVGTLVWLPKELKPAELARLATWTPREGAGTRAWPRTWTRLAGRAVEWDDLLASFRRARRQQCRRAFLGPPYCLAPAVALLLLKEEEVRGIASIHEAGSRPDMEAALARALSASALGA